MPSVAIIECLTLHTEVMGGSIALFREYGYDVTLYFNYSDPWHMIDVYKEYYPWIKDIHSWHELFITPVSNSYDLIMLNTSDEWTRTGRQYRNKIEEWNRAGKLCVVHHETLYLSIYPQYKRFIGLSPAYGSDKWFLPMYKQPTYPDIVQTNNQIEYALPPLVCVGSLNSKDREDVSRYITAGGSVTNYVRYKDVELVEKYGPSFQCYESMNGVDLMKALTTTISNGRGFMWFPILRDTSYATSKYTGSITLGVDVNAILIMPRVLRDLYNMCPESVITYETTITESKTLSEIHNAVTNPSPYMKAMYEWKQKQWNINMENWRRLLDSDSVLP